MDEIINYVMETPGNTNPNVLKGLLENYNEGGGSDSSELMVVKITSADIESEYTFSHTPTEVYNWLAANKPAIAVMNGIIGKVYLGGNSSVICAIPRFWSVAGGGDQTTMSEGVTFSGQYNGVEWGINPYLRIIGADEILSEDSSRDNYAIIYSDKDEMPYYQPINIRYEFDGALSQLVMGAITMASPEVALSTVFESTAPEFDVLTQIIEQIYESFVGRCRGVMLQGITDQNNRDSWLVKNVTGSSSGIYITADTSYTNFIDSSPSTINMITLTIASTPDKVVVTAICKNINTTIV